MTLGQMRHYCFAISNITDETIQKIATSLETKAKYYSISKGGFTYYGYVQLKSRTTYPTIRSWWNKTFGLLPMIKQASKRPTCNMHYNPLYEYGSIQDSTRTGNKKNKIYKPIVEHSASVPININ